MFWNVTEPFDARGFEFWVRVEAGGAGGGRQAAGDGAGDERGALFLQLLDQLPLLPHQRVQPRRLPVEKVRDRPLFVDRRKRNPRVADCRLRQSVAGYSRRRDLELLIYGASLKRPEQIITAQMIWVGSRDAEMITTHEIVRSLSYQSWHGNVAPFFRVICDDDVINFMMELPDLFSCRRCFHQRHVGRYSLVVIHIRVIAEPNWHFIVRRYFVDITDPASRRCLEPLRVPVFRNVR